MIDTIYNFGHNLLAATWWTAAGWPVIWNLIKIICVLLPLLGAVAYATLWERKFLGWIQVRHGPNRVGPMGLLQPIADALKLLTKEHRDNSWRCLISSKSVVITNVRSRFS